MDYTAPPTGVSGRDVSRVVERRPGTETRVLTDGTETGDQVGRPV